MSAKNTKKASTNSLIAMIVAGVMLGWLTGFAVGNNLNTDDEKSDKTSQDTNTMMKVEKTIDVPAEGAPTVELLVEKDSMGGYNVRVVTTNFKFTPESAGQEDVNNQGHAHIYVDGVKVGRVYGEWYYLADQGDGDKEITVSLNGNSHATFTVDGQKIEDTVIVADDGHSHDESDPEHSHN
jgi:hypothetical protein